MAKLLALDDSPHVQLFRTIVRIISDDDTIRRIVRPSSLRSWQGVPIDAAEFSEPSAPGLRFTPTQGTEAWWTPAGFRGNLVVQVEMLTKGTSIDDAFNLWWTVKHALYPADRTLRMPIVATLRSNYMLTLSMFSRLIMTNITTTHIHSAGEIAVEVREDLDN